MPLDKIAENSARKHIKQRPIIRQLLAMTESEAQPWLVAINCNIVDHGLYVYISWCRVGNPITHNLNNNLLSNAGVCADYRPHQLDVG